MKLKRCPFCNGHNLTLKVRRFTSFIMCLDCHAGGPILMNDEDAILAWNAEGEHQNQSALVATGPQGYHFKNRDDLKEVEA